MGYWIFASIAEVTAALGAFTLGWVLGGRKQKPRAYMCGCGHPLAMHSPETKECSYLGLKKLGPNNFVDDPCPCRQYVGDIPPEQIDWTKLGLPPA